MLYAACDTWAGFMALRFVMGFVESAIAPCLTMLVVSFYKKQEQPQRNASKAQFVEDSDVSITPANELYSHIRVLLVSFQRLLRLGDWLYPRFRAPKKMAVPLPLDRFYQRTLLAFPLPRTSGQPNERSLPYSGREILGRAAACVKQNRHFKQSMEMGPSLGSSPGREDLVDIFLQRRYQHSQRRTASLWDNYHLRPWFQQSQSELAHHAIWHRCNLRRLVLQLYRQPHQPKDFRCLWRTATAYLWHGARLCASAVERGWTIGWPVFHVFLLA